MANSAEHDLTAWMCRLIIVYMLNFLFQIQSLTNKKITCLKKLQVIKKLNSFYFTKHLQNRHEK